MNSLFRLIDFVINLYIFIIIIRVILSWIPHNPHSTIVKFTYQITEPPLNWIRQWVPNLGGLDISPMILIVSVVLAKRIIFSILF